MVEVKPVPSARPETARTLRLPQATALILGSIIGVGIFNLPYSLASIGPISIIAMALTTVGALALALMFAALSRRLPADGGPYAYARAAFGNRTGFANAWSYWITAWAGNAAIVTGWVFYVEHFINKGGVVRGFGTPDAQPIPRATPGALRREHFPAGSMGPKVEAVCRFVEITGDLAAIGALSDAGLILAGKAGTVVTPGGDYGGPHDLKPPGPHQERPHR